MDSNFTNEDFEDFLKRNADGMRMRPSDQVWEGIAANLKKRRRRVAFATSAFLLLSSVLGYFLVDTSKEITNSAVATLPSEIQESKNSSSSASNTHSSETATEAKVIDINQRRLNSLGKDALVNRSTVKSALVTTESSSILAGSEATLSSFDTFTPTIIDSEVSGEAEAATNTTEEISLHERILSIESVTNLFKAGRKKAKMRLQFFFTPTVSYRKLSENTSYLRSLPQTTLLSASRPSFSINDAVTHRPDIGFELGFGTKYPVTKSINFIAGLQVNMSQYDIKAFRSSTSEVATIALSSQDNRVDFVGTVTDIRNYNGFRNNWLKNNYLQISLPVGAEVDLFRKNNTSFGVAGTVQPSYLISDRSYILSTDYKNYAEVPSLTRHVNVSAGIHGFVKYSTGKMNWQLGPQVRYQLLSSFVSEYPINEHLIDFGIKVGISINKKGTESPK